MNTEILLIFPTDREKIYSNRIHNFIGTIEEAKVLAQKYNYGGGVEIVQEKLFPFKRTYEKV